jgi:hypothetical protein
MLLRMSIRLEDGEGIDQEAQSDAVPFAVQLQNVRKLLGETGARLARARAAGDHKQVASLHQLQDQQTRQEQALVQGRGQGIKVVSDDLFTLQRVLVCPVEGSIELNGFRCADKLTASFPFSDLPLTSRAIRACLVEAFLGEVDASAFADPRNWKLPIDGVNPMFKGYADEWKTTHSSGGAEVRLECRSMEAILIDQKINKLSPLFQVGRIANPNGGVSVQNDESITSYLNRLFANLPNTGGQLGGDQLVAKMDPRVATEPRINRKDLVRALQTAKSQAQAAGAQPGQPPPVPPDQPNPDQPGQLEGAGSAQMPQPHANEISAWDLVTIACELVGCMPVYDPIFDPDAIIIRMPQTGFDVPGQGLAPPDGFSATLTDPDTNQQVQTPYRFMVWGRNIRELATSRKLGRVKASGVIVYAYNPDGPPATRQLTAQFPPKSQPRATSVKASGKGKVDEYITKVVYGVRNQAQLEDIACSIYHQIAQHETSLHIQTDDMTSYQDAGSPTGTNPDVLRLRPGTAVRVAVARKSDDPASPTISPLGDVFSADEVQLKRFLLEQYDRFPPSGGATEVQKLQAADQVAGRIAAVTKSQQRNNHYYVRSICHKFSQQDGWAADMEVVTFIDARSNPDNLQGDAKRINDRHKKKITKTRPPTAGERAASVVGKGKL